MTGHVLCALDFERMAPYDLKYDWPRCPMCRAEVGGLVELQTVNRGVERERPMHLAPPARKSRFEGMRTGDDRGYPIDLT